ncbi:MAG: hypothetical protein KGP35_02965 [Bacteroidetes bacterium]|nr:hypothetical protein [Bacteroidota bacterium]
MNTASIANFIATKIPDSDTAATLAALTERYPLFETGHLLQSILDPHTKKQKKTSILYAPLPLLMEQRIRAFQKPQPKEVAEELVFDALHTIDYFASQGIKLQQEHLGNDQLSKQVKTFTQWLKTMKKVYNVPEGKTPSAEDNSVTKIAQNSNDSAEIITETMAGILVQQGKREQAILVYQKLSLLYPEKSSYFTTQINELKN